MKDYLVIYEQAPDGGWGAHSPDVEGVFALGETRSEVEARIAEALAAHLAAQGFKAEHVNRIGLGPAEDSDIWAYAIEHRAVLITKDGDFAALARRGCGQRGGGYRLQGTGYRRRRSRRLPPSDCSLSPVP